MNVSENVLRQAQDERVLFRFFSEEMLKKA
jgi:hypothetical protein